jgi:hypothetical protein
LDSDLGRERRFGPEAHTIDRDDCISRPNAGVVCLTGEDDVIDNQRTMLRIASERYAECGVQLLPPQRADHQEQECRYEEKQEHATNCARMRAHGVGLTVWLHYAECH